MDSNSKSKAGHACVHADCAIIALKEREYTKMVRHGMVETMIITVPLELELYEINEVDIQCRQFSFFSYCSPVICALVWTHITALVMSFWIE